MIDNASGKIIGSSRYYEWNSVEREVAVGFTFLARSHWGGGTNREMKQFMLSHAFRWAKVVWFHVGATIGVQERQWKKSAAVSPMRKAK